MAELKIAKTVASLPTVLEPDAIYIVRVGDGFDIHVTNGVGAVSAYRLNVDLELDSKVDNNDPRLSDAREWSESIVSQVEAEKGTSGTARKWSAQRVRQAIAAWFQTVSTAFTRTLLSRESAAEVRDDLELGTAATRDVGTDSGNVMEVGAFGVGGIIPNIISDIDSEAIVGGLYRYDSSTSGEIPSVVGTVLNIRINDVEWTQFAQDWVSPRAFIRTIKSGLPTSWVEIISSDNLLTTTGQSTTFPMNQKATTDAINARGFEDASGVLTKESGALSNTVSQFLQATTQDDAKSRIGIDASVAKLRMRLDGDTLYITNDGSAP